MRSPRWRAGSEPTIEAVLEAPVEDVAWANGWEGGCVVGRSAVREHWNRAQSRAESDRAPAQAHREKRHVSEHRVVRAIALPLASAWWSRRWITRRVRT